LLIGESIGIRVEEDSREIHGVELCLEGFNKICSGGSERIIGGKLDEGSGISINGLG
jgi:hypothetical protein